MAGYSGTPLAQKLGWASGMTVAAIGAPEGFPDLVGVDGLLWRSTARGPIDSAVVFFLRRRDVARRWPAVTRAVGPFGSVWVAWPKRASGIASDLTDQTFRDDLLDTGWVDVKVCAIDDTWSGMKFVLRKKLRPV
jgi:hypothetical protein